MKKMILLFTSLILCIGVYAAEEIYEVDTVRFKKDFKFRSWERNLGNMHPQKIKQSVLYPPEKLILKSKKGIQLAYIRDLYITIYQNSDFTMYADLEYNFIVSKKYQPKNHFQCFYIIFWSEENVIDIATFGTWASLKHPIRGRRQNRLVMKPKGYTIENMHKITIVPVENKWKKVKRSKK